MYVSHSDLHSHTLGESMIDSIIAEVEAMVSNMACERFKEDIYIDDGKLFIEFFGEEIDLEVSLPVNIPGWTLVDIKMSTSVMSHRQQYWTHTSFALVFEKA